MDIKFCHVVLAFGKIRFCDLKRKDQSYKVIVESESQGTGIFEKEKMPESGIPFVEPAAILIDPDKIFEAAPVIVYIFRFFGIVIELTLVYPIRTILSSSGSKFSILPLKPISE